MSEKSLLILGAGAHGQVVKEVALDCGFTHIAFLDDHNPEAIGKISDLVKFKHFQYAFVSIGNAIVRQELNEKLKQNGFIIPTLIHPSAYVSESSNIGEGTLVEPKVIINSNVTIGEGCILSIGALLDHNAQVGKYSQINAGCILKSAAIVKDYIKLEVGDIIY